jgi:hypothetical protein
MAIAFTSVAVRSTRRVRLFFSEALAPTAFDLTSYYSVIGVSLVDVPPVVEAFAISGLGSACELALGKDLVEGETYQVSVHAVPAAGGSSTQPVESLTLFVGALPHAPRSVDKSSRSLTDEIYGEDLVWADGDFVEDPTGDLASVGGTVNVTDALERRLVSDGLDWDETYGGKLRRFVDGPRASAGEMRGLCTRQLLLDDRVRTASTRVASFDSTRSEQVSLECSVTLVGGEQVSPQAKVSVG